MLTFRSTDLPGAIVLRAVLFQKERALVKKDPSVKKLKKLKLSRETLRNLNERDLQAAMGGGVTDKTICSACCSVPNCP